MSFGILVTSDPVLSQLCLDALEICPFQYLSIWYLVLPCDVEEFLEAVDVEPVKDLLMSNIGGPGLTGMK